MNSVRRSSKVKSSLPTILISRILATVPSSISNLTATRLRSNGLTTVLTVAPYLPVERYCRLISFSALSNSDLSKIKPSEMPTCFNPSVILSEGKDRLPLNSILAMAERS